MPSLDRQKHTELIKLGPFSGLANTSPIRVPPGKALACSNIAPNRVFGAWKPMRGRSTNIGGIFAPTLLGVGQPLAMAKFITAAGQAFIVVQTADGVYPVPLIGGIQFGGGVAGWSEAFLPTIDNLGTSQAPGTFCAFDKWLFFVNPDPNGHAYKINGQLVNGSYFATSMWQILQPQAPPTAILQAGSGFFAQSLYYKATYSNATQESSPCLGQVGPLNPGQSMQPPNSNSAAVTQSLAPIVNVAGGGTIPIGNYTVRITYVDSSGTESGVSLSTSASITSGNQTLQVQDNTPPAGAVSFNTYVASGAGLGHLQSNTAIGGTAVVNTYSSSAGGPPAFLGFVTTPSAPSLTAVAGGSLPQRVEAYVLTFTNSSGESYASPEAAIVLQAGQIAQITSPPTTPGVTGYKVYGSQTSGQEVLQAGPIAIGTNWTAPTTGIVLGQNVQLDCPISPDPQVTTINFYRIDVFNAQWLYVGSVPNQSYAGGAALGYARFVDSTQDAAVVGQTLIEHRDRPAPFYDIVGHKNRVWGFGHDAWQDGNVFFPAGPSDLWYSNEGEPWGFDNTSQVIQVNANQYGDVGIAVRPVSGGLMCIKSRSSWILYGDSPNDFQPPQEIGRNLGGINKNLCLTVMGILWFATNQGIMRFDGNLSNISDDIKPFYDGLTAADFATACFGFANGVLVFSVPTQSVSYCYHEASQTWWTTTQFSPLFASDPDGMENRPYSVDTLVGFVKNNTQLASFFYGTTDPFGGNTSGAIFASWTSGVWKSPRASWWRLSFLEVIGESNQLAGTTITAKITVNPGTGSEQSVVIPVTLGMNPLYLSDLPDTLQGAQFQLTLMVASITDYELQEATLYGFMVRDLNTEDSI